MPDAFEQFAEIAKAINDGALQREMEKYRKCKNEHDKAASALEASAVKEKEAANASLSTMAEIDRKTAALEGGKTKLANDKTELVNTRREFDEYRDAENASLDARGKQLVDDEKAAAKVLAMKAATEKKSVEVNGLKAQYEARLADLGLAPI